MTSIIIVTWNNKSLLDQCLQSLFKHTAGNYEVIIVSNGCTDGTVEYLQQLEKENGKIKCVYNKENLGFVKANNQGILMAQGQYICLLNNDTILTPYWLTKLKRVLEQDPRVGIVGPYTNYAAGRQMIRINAKTEKEIDEFLKNFRMPEQDVDSLIFFCVLIRAELFNQNRCGLLDVDFHPRNFEDNFFCWQAKQLNYKLKIANTFIFHIGSQSFKKNPQEFTALLGRNQKTFYRKTGREIKISLCIAVSDQEKPETLKRCLDSAAPFVDEVCINFNYRNMPIEYDTLDYGNWVIPKKYQAVLMLEQTQTLTYPLGRTKYTKWHNDFSEAKNNALDLASGQWCFMLDCSDTLEMGLALRKYIVENQDICDYMFINTFARHEDGIDTHLRHVRIIKNDSRYRYRKPVHEDILLSLKEYQARALSTEIVIRHHGYETPGATFSKNFRNYRIMRKHVINNPNADSLDMFHLVNAYIIFAGQSKIRRKQWYGKALLAIDRCLNIPLQEDDPLWPKMTFLKARIFHEGLNQIDQAKEWYKIGIEKKNYIESHLGLAEIFVAEKNYDMALCHLEIMLKIGTETGFEVTSVPKNLTELEEAMNYNLGVCYFARNDLEKAKAYLQTCIKINNFHLKAIDLLCECLRRQKHYGTAFQISLKAINFLPHYVNGWVNAGGYELSNGNFSTAKVLLQEALRLDPNNAVAKNNLEMLKSTIQNISSFSYVR